MMLPTDPKLAKLRILWNQAQRRQEPIVAAAEAAIYTARRETDEAWMAYLHHARELGYCAVCEKPLAECKCVWMA